MNSPKTQPKTDANTAAGNLGFINTMQEQLLQHKGKQNGVKPLQNSPQPAQNAPQQEQKPEVNKEPHSDLDGLETRIMSEIVSLRKEIQDSKPKERETEIEELKKQIEEALHE